MIYVFFAPGFEEMEATAALDILRRAELNVQSVGVGSKTVTGAHGITYQCDITDDQLSLQELEMIVLPGGMPGTLNLERSETVQACIDFVVEHGKWLCAICAAPSILGHKGLLKGKRCTCYPGFESQLGEGALFTGQPVEQDGRLITGKGPGAAVSFGIKLVENLLDGERARQLEAALQ